MGENEVPRERGGPFKYLSAIAHWLSGKGSLRRALESSAMPTLDFSGKWSLRWGLGIASLAVATSVLVRVDVLGALGTSSTYVTFFPSVAIAAFAGGLPAGALATALAALAVSLYIAPPIAVADWLGLAIFLLGCALTIGITEAMHRARARALQAEEQARITGALRESEERFRTLVEQAPDGIFVGSAEGRYVDVNSAACRMLGYSREEILHLGIADLVAADEVLRVAPELARLRCGEPTVNEWRFRRKDGSLLHSEVSARQLPDGRLQAFLRDISDRKRDEAELKDREGRLRAVFEATDDAIIPIDENGLIQSINPATVRLFGYEACELVGRNVSMLMPEPYRSEHDRYIQSYLATGKAKIIGIGREVEALRKDGTVFPVELAVSEAAREGPRLFVGVVHDITERKRAEKRQLELMEELKQSEREAHQRHFLFRSIFEGTPEGIILTDLQRRVVMVNPALTRMFGYETDELIGSPISKLYAPAEDSEQIGEISASSNARRSAHPSIISCQRKNGEAFPGEIIKVPYSNGSGQLLGSLGIIRDVTWELRREEELRGAQRLEALVQLTGGIAHDFNNLLTVISGNLQLLGLTLKDERLVRYLGEAERAAEMGARLNQRLMTFARQRRLAPVATNLNEQVVDMRELLQRTIGENITVTTALATGVWPVLVDPSEIESAVLNLAINARDAMPNGGKLLIQTENVVIAQFEEQARQDLPPGSYVRLSVSDTGSGMSPEVLARAFEPFFTTKEPGKGTGLGLASIYGFVKQSAGHVTIYSEVGRGTSVNIYLSKLDAGEPANLASQEASALIEGTGETILVVEDNPAVRRLTVERLKMLRYQVLEADNALNALTALEAGKTVDLIFSDVIMPGGMSGFELARKIRELRPSLRILLTSGFAGEIARAGEDAIHCLPMLRKPYTQTELGYAIQATLKAEGRRHQPGVTSAANT